VAPSSEGTLAGDRLRLEQALGNLVDNALRHGAGRVTLEGRAEDSTVTLRVSDQGPGFPEPFLPQAFDRFSRADEARTRGAAGLGLAIVDAVARAHGGSASARNVGGGAEVAISLPAR
jgi:signal transduction histidine kinase